MTRRQFIRNLSLAAVSVGLANKISERGIVKFVTMMPEEKFKEVSSKPITATTFQELLNEYFPMELLKEEIMKRDYLLSKVENDSWAGGGLVVPLKFP